ncbi:DeoR family transcriptional regulator [Paenibacillus sp. LMG 31456]|uniref:DeoR family transcriptional regulator n=2 Tax=Paenibacillus foliorum TaxID=2654974 RepID=A0A972GWB0_9BACL|nr:DeoR family transcriptional regulator [Paenibacillus foliorum]
MQLLKTNSMMKINDLCEQLNVSQATIRRDLTELREQGVERVGGAAFYKQASFASNDSLTVDSSNQVGCIISVSHKHMRPYFLSILEGIEKGLANHGYSLAFMHNLDDIQNEAILDSLLKESKIKGMIVVEGIKSEIYARIKKQFPTIVGIDISDHTVPVIAYDRINAAKSAVQHLIDQGHQAIGFIGGAGLTGDLEREKRYRGYKYALQEAGLELDSEWIINAGWDVNVSYSRMLELLDSSSHRPTAIFAASDLLAISAMRAVTEKGLRIPEDIAFIGLDNIEISQYTTPPLSSVHIPKYEIGMAAAKTLVDYLEAAYTLPFKMLMPYEVIVRESSIHLKK